MNVHQGIFRFTDGHGMQVWISGDASVEIGDHVEASTAKSMFRAAQNRRLRVTKLLQQEEDGVLVQAVRLASTGVEQESREPDPIMLTDASKVRRFERSIDKLKYQLEQVTRERDSLAGRVKVLEQGGADADPLLRKRLETAEQELAEAKRELDEADEELTSVRKERDELRRVSISYQQEMSEKSGVIQRLQKELDAERERADAMEKEAREAMDEAEKAMDAVEQLAESLRHAEGDVAAEAQRQVRGG